MYSVVKLNKRASNKKYRTAIVPTDFMCENVKGEFNWVKVAIFSLNMVYNQKNNGINIVSEWYKSMLKQFTCEKLVPETKIGRRQ